MSRVIVKNIPAYLSDTRLREHFAVKGTVTDVKLVHRQDGHSRRFGFVGFKTEDEAQKAKEYFNRTYIDSSRITVEIVDSLKSKEPPNKRQRLSSFAASSSNPSTSTVKPPAKKQKDDQVPLLKEFMDVMQPRNKQGRSWANEAPPDEDTIMADPSSASQSTKPSKKDKRKGSTNAEDGPDSNEGRAEGMSDLDWMKSRMRRGIEESKDDKVFHQSDEEDDAMEEDSIVDERQAVPPQPSDEDQTREAILATSRLFLRNLAFTCTNSDLEEAFKPFGDISQIHIPLDPVNKASKGLAFITFALPTQALAAYDAMDGKTFQGRLLHVLPAVDRKPKPEGDGKAKSVKESRQEKRKEFASKEFSWGMLYMNSDAVVSSVADRLKISKGDILNPESDNAAVKLALAETHVIQETKKYLEDEGVVLDAFKSRQRSDTAMLVKNIPYGTTLDELHEMFSSHGDISRLLLPAAGTMAVVEFVHPVDAQSAFKAIAYRRLKNSIIYLEKAPLGIFAPSKDGQPNRGKLATGIKPVTIAEQSLAEARPAEDEEFASGSTLFIKNLNFSTTSDRLTRVFQGIPSFSFARVQMKPDPKNPSGPRLSMGYGFVGFKDAEAARKAVKSLQGFTLDGHALLVKFAQRGVEEEKGKDAKGVGKSKTTKMIVKNVPFEATTKDIRELFGAHGQLKSVRVPRKMDRSTRGFAFLDFVSRHEAENAFNALKHTHLLGRHIVLEWAEENDVDLDKLREKIKIGYGDGGPDLPGRKRKLDLDVAGPDALDDEG